MGVVQDLIQTAVWEHPGRRPLFKVFSKIERICSKNHVSLGLLGTELCSRDALFSQRHIGLQHQIFMLSELFIILWCKIIFEPLLWTLSLFIRRMSDDHIRMDVMSSAAIYLFTFKGQSKANNYPTATLKCKQRSYLECHVRSAILLGTSFIGGKSMCNVIPLSRDAGNWISRFKEAALDILQLLLFCLPWQWEARETVCPARYLVYVLSNQHKH